MAQGYPVAHTLLTNDPPSHTRLRAIVNKACCARRVATMERPLGEIANELLDRFACDGRVELLSQFAVGLPLTVIAHALGVQRANMDKFKRWSDDAVAPLGGLISYRVARGVRAQPGRVPTVLCGAARLERWCEPRDDILTDLINARASMAASRSTRLRG